MTTATIESRAVRARMDNPLQMIPDSGKALFALADSTDGRGLPDVTAQFVRLRASQLNGCTFCVNLHWRELKELGESDERIHAVSAWHEAPWFTSAERAALALTEAATRLSDRTDAVSDDIWAEAVSHYDPTALAALIVNIGLINAANRVFVAIRQPAISGMREHRAPRPSGGVR